MHIIIMKNITVTAMLIASGSKRAYVYIIYITNTQLQACEQYCVCSMMNGAIKVIYQK